LNLPSINARISKLELKKYVKENIGRQKNNRKFMNLIEKLSIHFTQHEANNIYKLNFPMWFDLVSELRHNIIHNRQTISSRLQDFLKHNNERAKLFQMFFEQKITNDGLIIFLTNEKFHIILDRLNDFAFFIFKSLSLDHNFSEIHQPFEFK
jgi:hypothetical protein